MTHFTLRAGAATRRVETVGPGEVDVDGRRAAVEVTAIDGATWQVTVDGRRLRVHMVMDGPDGWAMADGWMFEVTRETGRPVAHAESADADALASPMPATVTRVLVAPGDAVGRGDTLVLLEAMKLELAIRAPRDGTVRELRCQEGALVEPGIPLIVLDQG